MPSFIEKLNDSKEIWFWSLKPGSFVDKKTGENPYPDLIMAPWTGTISEWNSSLIETCSFMARCIFEKTDENDVLHLSEIIYGKMTSNMLEKWHGKIRLNNQLSFDTIVIESEKVCGTIKVLNISSKGNLK